MAGKPKAEMVENANKPTNNKGNMTKVASGFPPAELLEDLSIRFVLNAPPEELESFERMLFLIEQAHWFYEDNVREKGGLRSLTLREFTELMFMQCASLKPYRRLVDDIYKSFNRYKHTVPVYGGILLNEAMTHVLLVRGWAKQASWGFPKGKVNAEEGCMECAMREVAEEVGYHCNMQEENFIELSRGQQLNRLYIVPGVSDNTYFESQTKKEIGKIEWFPISAFSKNPGDDTKKFFMVHPFIGHLKRWIRQNKNRYASSSNKKPPEMPPEGAVHPWLNFSFDLQKINECFLRFSVPS